MTRADDQSLVLPDPAAVARAAAAFILQCASDAITARGRFSLVLAGGRTPLAAYRLLAQAQIDAGRWHIYFGDERCLPPEDPQRNSLAARQAWLDASGIPGDQIHIMPAELGAEAAAGQYARTIAGAQPFDLVLLGMGEDGHVASLFPGQEHPARLSVVPVRDAPKPPPDRVSLSYDCLCAARQRLLLVTGAGKRDALAAWRRGDELPVARVAGCGPLILMLDEAADIA